MVILVLKVFSKILSQSVRNKLKSKESYLAGGGCMVLRVSWDPGRRRGCWFPLNGRVLGTRGSRGTFKKKLKIDEKYSVKPLVFLGNSSPPACVDLRPWHLSTTALTSWSHMNFPCSDMGFEPRPPWPVMFSYPTLYPLSQSGQHTCSCSELLLLSVFL